MTTSWWAAAGSQRPPHPQALVIPTERSERAFTRAPYDRAQRGNGERAREQRQRNLLRPKPGSNDAVRTTRISLSFLGLGKSCSGAQNKSIISPLMLPFF